MFMQSAAMALGFGSFFQYGKRKLSAMSNEEFNALTPEALTSQLMSSINNMIPTVEQSFHQMEQMNVMILDAMAKYFDQGVQFLGRWISGGAANLTSNIQNPVDAFPETGEFISGLLPSAYADEGRALSGGGTRQKFASDYEREAMRLGFKLLLQIVKTFGTRTDIPIEKRVGYIAAFKILEQREKDKIPPKITPDEAITKSGATGIVEYIARTTATLKALLKKTGFLQNTKLLNQFHALATAYNVKMATTRKADGTTYHSLRIDIGATWNKKPLQIRYFK